MKVKRMLAIDKKLFERLNDVCEKNDFYRNSFVTTIIQDNIDLMNTFNTSFVRVRQKEKKARFQIYIEEDLYNKIEGKKIYKIERILDIVLGGYENETNK